MNWGDPLGAAAMLAGLLASSEDQRMAGLPSLSRMGWAGGLGELGQGSRRPGGSKERRTSGAAQ